MQTNYTEAAQEALLDLIKPLSEEEQQLQLRLDEIQQAKAPLEAALNELKSKKHPKSRQRSKAGKKTVCKQDVLSACLKLVDSNYPIYREDLKELVKDKLTTEKGVDLRGFELRFKEVLASQDFDVSKAGAVSPRSTAIHSDDSKLSDSIKTPVDSFGLGVEVD